MKLYFNCLLTLLWNGVHINDDIGCLDLAPQFNPREPVGPQVTGGPSHPDASDGLLKQSGKTITR
jgi:hypothetical protein